MAINKIKHQQHNNYGQNWLEFKNSKQYYL